MYIIISILLFYFNYIIIYYVINIKYIISMCLFTVLLTSTRRRCGPLAGSRTSNGGGTEALNKSIVVQLVTSLAPVACGAAERSETEGDIRARYKGWFAAVPS